MYHPYGVNNEAAKSPLPGFADGVHKIIKTAI